MGAYCMKLPTTINNSISSLIDEYHESKTELPRPHMGVSGIGNECDRYLWLNFRWAATPKFTGRILRLSRRGHLEENQRWRPLLDLESLLILKYFHD